MASTISRIKRRAADTMEAPAVAINQCIGKINSILYYSQKHNKKKVNVVNDHSIILGIFKSIVLFKI